MQEKIKYGKCSNCGVKKEEEKLYIVNKLKLCSRCKSWLKKTPNQQIKKIDEIFKTYPNKDITEAQKILIQRQQLCQKRTII